MPLLGSILNAGKNLVGGILGRGGIGGIISGAAKKVGSGIKKGFSWVKGLFTGDDGRDK